jgi:hypothetical protein
MRFLLLLLHARAAFNFANTKLALCYDSHLTSLTFSHCVNFISVKDRASANGSCGSTLY